MAEFSNYLENKVLDHVLRNTSYTSPTTVYVGLYTSDPTDAGSGTEVSGGSYARQVLRPGQLGEALRGLQRSQIPVQAGDRGGFVPCARRAGQRLRSERVVQFLVHAHDRLPQPLQSLHGGGALLAKVPHDQLIWLREGKVVSASQCSAHVSAS